MILRFFGPLGFGSETKVQEGPADRRAAEEDGGEGSGFRVCGFVGLGFMGLGLRI